MDMKSLVDKYFDQIKGTIAYDEEDSAYLSFSIPKKMLEEYVKRKNKNTSLFPKFNSLPDLKILTDEIPYSKLCKICEDRERIAEEFWRETNLLKKFKEYGNESKEYKPELLDVLDILEFLDGPIICSFEIVPYDWINFSVQEIRENL